MKRVLDIVLALAALAVCLLPMLVLAALVKLTSRGPALYWSDRIGRGSVIFRMPKFRTMRVGTPEVAAHLLGDGRHWMTPIGNLLRRTSLDELPQLWSILKGDLSFVGPRPALFNQDDLIALRTACGVDRLTPGLTGWAQINGRNELTNTEKVAFDAWYAANRSLWLDLKILFATFGKVVHREDHRTMAMMAKAGLKLTLTNRSGGDSRTMETSLASPSGEAGWLNWINERPRLFLCGCALLLALQTSSLHYPSRDGVLYLSLAKSVARDENPSLLGDPSIYIPPFYSVVISPFFWLSDEPFLFLSLFELCIASLLLWGVYRWAKIACPRAAVLLPCLVVLNQSVLVYYRRTLKETLFMALTIWAINLSHDLLNQRMSRVRTVLTALVASLLMCGLALTRYAALIFPVIFSGCLMLQVLQRSRGFFRATFLAGAVTLPAAAAVFFWVTRGMDYQNEGHLNAALMPYSAPPVPAAEVAPPQVAASGPGITAPAPSANAASKPPLIDIRWNMLLDGLRFRISDISRLLVPGMWKAPALSFDSLHPPVWVIYLPVAAVCALGWYRLARERLDVLVCAVPLWIGIYIHATAEAYGRLLNPLLPVLCACFFVGLRTFLSSDRRVVATMAVLLIGHVAQAAGYWLLIDRPRAIHAAQERPVIDQLADFLRKNPQPVAILDKLDQTIWLMLIFSLDREVQHPVAMRRSEPPPRWFVSHRSQSDGSAGATAFSAADYIINDEQKSPIASAASSVTR